MRLSNALYTDLSHYYDLMCADIDYHTQSLGISRLDALFGNSGKRHLDLACGTAPHIFYLLQSGYQCSGLDLHRPMLEQAALRCPEASFIEQDLCHFQLTTPVDFITCLLYSLHYSATREGLQSCLAAVYQALNPGGVFCFNAVDKDHINNQLSIRHQTTQHNSVFTFESGWYYSGQGEQQRLQLNITKTSNGTTEYWQDSHTMVAINFAELTALLTPYFDVHILEHDYHKIMPWDKQSGNALFVCIKR